MPPMNERKTRTEEEKPVTRETKIGLVVASSFLCLVGVVVYAKMRGGDSASAQQPMAQNAPESPPEKNTLIPTIPPDVQAPAVPKNLPEDIIRASSTEPAKKPEGLPVSIDAPPLPAFPSNKNEVSIPVPSFPNTPPSVKVEVPKVEIPKFEVPNFEPAKKDPFANVPPPNISEGNVSLPAIPSVPAPSFPAAAPVEKKEIGAMALNGPGGSPPPLPSFPPPSDPNPNNLTVKPKTAQDLLAQNEKPSGNAPPPIPPPNFGAPDGQNSSAPPLPPSLPDLNKKPDGGPSPFPPAKNPEPNFPGASTPNNGNNPSPFPPPNGTNNPNNPSPFPPPTGQPNPNPSPFPPPVKEDPFKQPAPAPNNGNGGSPFPPINEGNPPAPPGGKVISLDKQNPGGSNLPPLGSNVPPVGAPPIGNEIKSPNVKVSQVISDTIRAEDTDFDQLSRRLFNTDKYARALLEFNREHPFGPASIKENPPRLQPGMKIFVPSAQHLDESYAKYLNMSAPRPIGLPTTPPNNTGTTFNPNPNPVGLNPPTNGSNFPARPANIGQPQPLGQAVTNPSTPTFQPNVPSKNPSNPGTGNPNPAPAVETTKVYRVPAEGQHIIEIARDTLRDGNRWPEIFRLNPTIQPAQRIPGGTQLRLPGNAQTP